MSFSPFKFAPWLSGLALAGLSLSGCDDGSTSQDPTSDGQTTDATAGLDSALDGGDAGLLDASPADSGAPDGALPPAERVELDLAPWLEPVEGAEGLARAYRSTERADLVSGEASTGLLGDYILENDRVRLVIEADDRAMGACPYGGNLIDGAVRGGQDVLGEVCLFLAMGQTLKPDRFEVLEDTGDAAVLAVTGHMEILDFFNLAGRVKTLGLPIQFGLETENPMPLTVTQYFILRPGDLGPRVVTALRNDGDEGLHFPFAQVIDSGGDLEFFNPSGPTGGFGYRGGFNIDAIRGDMLTLLAFQGPGGSHLFLPELNIKDEGLPAAGAYVGFAGAAVAVTGSADILQILLASKATLETMPGLVHLQPGEVHVNRHWRLIGTPSLNSVLDRAWALLGLEPEALGGTVTAGGAPTAGVRVSAVDGEGRTMNQTFTDAEGRFEMLVPPGTYTARAWGPGLTAVEVEALAPGQADLEMAPSGTLRVTVLDAAGEPTPGRVFVGCEGACPNRPTANDQDISFDALSADAAAVIYVGMDGIAEIPLVPGDYKVTVSRGPEWSVWPADAIQTGGAPVTVIGGEQTDAAAEIAHVVDTSGAVSGDYHVHGINSPDSPVALRDRVLNFLGEGVDVLVGTDHDFVTDYGQTIAALGAGAQLQAISGVEVTTSDYGHYNGFPIAADPEDRSGGALDWGRGAEPGLTPDEILQWIDDQPGEQVVMVNHPDKLINSLEVDILSGVSRADPTLFRLPAVEPDPETGDTGLWTERFNSIEIYNREFSVSYVNHRMRWWLMLLGKGFTPTATAVSDTHTFFKKPGGGPRSYSFSDAPYSTAGLVEAVKSGRVIGTNGPFFRFEAQFEDTTVGLGETLAVPVGDRARFFVHLDLPEWMEVDTLEVLSNLEDAIIVPVGEERREPIEPTLTIPIEWLPEHTQVAATGDLEHRHKVQTIEFELPVTADAYVVVMIRSAGDGAPSMYPIVPNASTRPLAFSNPIYLDADGGGYNHPVLAQLQSAAPAERAAQPIRDARPEDIKALLKSYQH